MTAVVVTLNWWECGILGGIVSIPFCVGIGLFFGWLIRRDIEKIEKRYKR